MARRSVPPELRDLALRRERNFRQLLVRAARSVNHRIFRELAAAGYDDVKLSHNAVFENLDETGGSVSLLADRAGMTKQSMSAIVHDLEQKGYVEMQPDPGDGRALVVRFTKHGWTLMLHVFRIIDAIERDVESSVGAEAFENLRTSLLTLRNDAQA